MHFLKAVRLSFRYKWTIIASVLNAIVIAVLWSATISSVYPFMEVVFEGKTLHTWFAESITAATAEADRLRGEIAGLRTEHVLADVERQVAISGQIAVREARIAAHEANREARLYYKQYIDRWGPTTPFGTLVAVVAFLIAATFVKGSCLVLSIILVARIAGGTVSDLRRIFFRNMLHMDQATIDRIGSTNLMTMLSHNIGLIQNGLSSLYGRSLIEPLKMVSCLIVAAAISWQLLLVTMFTVPFGMYLIYKLGRAMRRTAGREIEGYAAVFQTLLDTVTGIKLVKIFTRERRERRRFKNNSQSMYAMSMRIALFDSLLRPITELMSIATLSTAMLCGAHLVLNRDTHMFGIRMSAEPLTAAEVFTFFAMLSGVADPARKMTDIYNIMLRAVMASRGLFTTFELRPRIAAPLLPRRAPLHNKSIRFENVTFGYDAQSPVLRNLNFEIPYGQTVAIVGVNGCGKSTVTNLIARFYDPNQGCVYLDDIDVRDIRPRQLRKQIGIVTQDPLLFRGTVWMNIRYGNIQATDEQVRRAAAMAHVTDFLHELPRGFQAKVGDRGAFLSGGQRQRVALARAVISDPRIFILDEATGQLDVEAESLVHLSLRDFIRDRTTILISHRPATLMLADRVIVMRDGTIVDDRPASSIGQTPEDFLNLMARAA